VGAERAEAFGQIVAHGKHGNRGEYVLPSYQCRRRRERADRWRGSVSEAMRCTVGPARGAGAR